MIIFLILEFYFSSIHDSVFSIEQLLVLDLAGVHNILQDSQQLAIQNHHRWKRVILEPETESDESNTKILIENEHFSITNLSTSHSSLNNIDDHEPSISLEALKYANSFAFPRIIETPAFTSHSTPDIIFIFYVRSLMLI